MSATTRAAIVRRTVPQRELAPAEPPPRYSSASMSSGTGFGRAVLDPTDHRIHKGLVAAQIDVQVVILRRRARPPGRNPLTATANQYRQARQRRAEDHGDSEHTQRAQATPWRRAARSTMPLARWRSSRSCLPRWPGRRARAEGEGIPAAMCQSPAAETKIITQPAQTREMRSWSSGTQNRYSACAIISTASNGASAPSPPTTTNPNDLADRALGDPPHHDQGDNAEQRPSPALPRPAALPVLARRFRRLRQQAADTAANEVGHPQPPASYPPTLSGGGFLGFRVWGDDGYRSRFSPRGARRRTRRVRARLIALGPARCHGGSLVAASDWAAATRDAPAVRESGEHAGHYASTITGTIIGRRRWAFATQRPTTRRTICCSCAASSTPCQQRLLHSRSHLR